MYSTISNNDGSSLFFNGNLDQFRIDFKPNSDLQTT